MTEFIVTGGQILAERKPNGDWSDHIYVGGLRIARADTYENRIRIHGTNSCSNCGQYTTFGFTGASA